MLSKFNNKKHRRLTALLLCVALMLGSVTSVSADISAADSETEAQSGVQTYAEESTAEAVSYGAPETQAEVQEETSVAEETEAPAADTQQTEAHTEAATEAHTETASETQAEPETETPVSEATELRQDFTDGISVIANLPDGAFEAATSDITMQVNELTSAQLTYITSLMDKEIDKDTYEVGDYVIFDIKFLVNGVETEPLKEITVNIKNSKINVGDVESAKVFYFDPHDTNTSSDDELAEIPQRSLLIKEFQKAGKSTANIDDYDLSNIILNDKGKATEINFEARKNTIYGCYVVNEIEKESETEDINKEETESETELESESESESETENELYTTDFEHQSLTYEDDQVNITVEEVEANAIPEGASLSVTPIVKDNSDTQAQYEVVEKLLQEKAENEDYDIAGFLAYDIILVDKDGNKVEPNGEVKVTMNYKQAVIADEAVQTVENTDGLDYNNNQTWKKLVEIKDALAGGEGVFTKQVEAAKTLLDELTTSEVANNNADIDSLEDYEKYRQEIIDNITNNKTISQAIKDKALSSDAIETEVDNYLSTLEGFSKYYNEWYDKFASDTAKGAEEVKNRFRKSIESDTNNFNFPDLNSKASGIEIFTNPELTFPTPKLSDEAKQEINDFNNWIDSLSNSDKDIVYKISTDFTSANVENQLKNLSEGDFDKWKQAVADYEIPEVDKFHFSDLVATEDFQNSVKDYEDKITKLADALKNLRNGELSESDKIELFENFPELASQADNLDGAIVSLLDNLDADIVEDFNNKLNYMETDDDVAALNNLKDSILNISSGARQISNVTSEITLLRDSLSNLKDTYNSVTDIMDNYNKNGYYSLENLQSLLELEPEYINTLIDENGQINLNSQAYKDYVAAKAKMLVVDQIKSLYENILAMTAEEAQAYANATAYQVESGSLQDLITTTTQYYLMLAKTKDAESGTTVYTESLQKSFGTVANYAAVYDSWLSSLNSSTNEFTNQTNKATSALENKKNALEDIKSGYENAIDSIKSLIDWTEKYIKQTKEDEIKSLEDKKKSVDDLIESQKELLQAQKDEYDWNKEISDKQNTVAKDALAASIANLDDSSAGKKSQKEATDALSESRSDMTDSLYEHSIDSRIDALDKLKDSSDEYYDSEIDKINEFLDNEVTLYKAACSMIDNDNGTLYGNLLNYCKTYTTTSEAEFNYMWTSAQSAMQDYNIANLDTFNLLNNLQVHIYEVDTAIDTIADSIQSYEDKISGVQTKLDSLSDSAQTAVSNISAALNKESELNKAKWYYDWQGKRYESSLSDKDSAIQDILRRIENKYGGRFPASAATIYGTIKHYAKGTRNSNGGLSVTQEDGFEAIFGKLQSGEYTMMPEGSQVFSNKMTDNLFNFSADPQRFITKLSSKFNYLNYFDSIQGNIDRKAKNIVNNSRQKNIGDITVNSAPIYIQGDATQSTVNALRAEADKIVNRATKNVMNIF